MNLSEKTLSEEIIYKGDYLTFTKVKVQLPDGNEANRDIIKEWNGEDPDKLFNGQLCWLTNKENVKNNIKY